MNSKERVYAALQFKQTQRVPRFIWFTSELTRLLMERHGLDEDELSLHYGNDVLQPWVGQNLGMAVMVDEGAYYKDDWGIVRKRATGHNSIVEYPVKDLHECRNYCPPKAASAGRFDHLERLLVQYGDSHFIGADVSPILFEAANNICGMQNVMIWLAEEEPALSGLLDRLSEFCVEASIEAIKRGVDWIWLGDDLGSQESMLISPQMWREHFKPRYKCIIDEIRRYKKDAYIAFHSCGSIRPIIADLAEVGINVLNPVQESAKNMVQSEIKHEFAGKLSLMCGIDTQYFIPNATPEQVREKTAHICRQLNEGGGYIFSASHAMQANMGDEKISAIYQGIADYEIGG